MFHTRSAMSRSKTGLAIERFRSVASSVAASPDVTTIAMVCDVNESRKTVQASLPARSPRSCALDLAQLSLNALTMFEIWRRDARKEWARRRMQRSGGNRTNSCPHLFKAVRVGVRRAARRVRYYEEGRLRRERREAAAAAGAM